MSLSFCSERSSEITDTGLIFLISAMLIAQDNICYSKQPCYHFYVVLMFSQQQTLITLYEVLLNNAHLVYNASTLVMNTKEWATPQ